ncbi:hypothetical protein CAPTEDRAFT_199688 [Capitella teleta]|uniref:Cerebral cavernous malformations 2 harmonin-homology domain-containing protein n=1 Tax=Capitella teleta TaxID=283909 RepID=R7VHK5_CAPTE|nr:hypothetical protein CAPTEDRAFT_199688 [Capitella teleta]|eukprot:ELU18099.1 hypothetical protein CAPTEDRAFT_199688 [Capitella teleta]
MAIFGADRLAGVLSGKLVAIMYFDYEIRKPLHALYGSGMHDSHLRPSSFSYHYEGVGRTSHRNDRDSRLMYERRPLKLVNLTPPDYKVPPQVLIESYLETEVRLVSNLAISSLVFSLKYSRTFDLHRFTKMMRAKEAQFDLHQESCICQVEDNASAVVLCFGSMIRCRSGCCGDDFAGVVSNIAIDLDATNRTEVLRAIDRGRREKSLPWVTNYSHDAILCLNAHNLKLSQRDGNEESLLRIAIHEIATVSYIRDDDLHIIAIKFGDPDRCATTTSSLSLDESYPCKLAVLYCDSRGSAVEICSLIDQCFLYLYQDATMQYFDSNLRQGAGGMGSSTLRSEKSSNSTPKKDLDSQNLGFISQSTLNLSSLPSKSSRRTNPYNSLARSESDIGPSGSDMIQKYMEKLYSKLKPDELKRFAQLMRAWKTNLPTRDFCGQVFELYGPERKHLLSGMAPFIPDTDLPEYESFLNSIGLGSASSSHSDAYRRQPSISSHDELDPENDHFDDILNRISHSIANMGSGIEPSNGTDIFLNKST